MRSECLTVGSPVNGKHAHCPLVAGFRGLRVEAREIPSPESKDMRGNMTKVLSWFPVAWQVF